MNKSVLCIVPILLLLVAGVAKNQDYRATVGGHAMKIFHARRATYTPQDMEILERKCTYDLSARAFLEQGRYAEAEANARQSYAMGSGLGRESLAAALYAQGKYEEALQVYTAIARSGANATRNEWPYALLLLKSGNWAQAVAAYDTALTLGGDTGLLRKYTQFDPDHPRPQELRAAILIGWATTPGGGDFQGSYEEKKQQGQAMYEEALSLMPRSTVARYYFAYGLERMGRRAEAKAAFQKAAAMDTQGDTKAAAEKHMDWL